MSSPEHQPLVEFLGRQFTGIERRFEVIDRRFDAADRQFTDLRHETLGHFDEIEQRLGR